MTLAEEISTLRNAIKEVNKDTVIPDSLLYSYWKKGRATVISQEYKRTNKLPEFLFRRYCINLTKIKAVECDCPELTNLGCDILRSSINIPDYIKGGPKDTLQIYTLGNDLVGLASPNQIKSDMLDPVKGSKPRAMIPNRKLEIWNDLGKTRLYIRMIPADPLEWSELEVCTSEGETYCPDIWNEETSITEDMSDQIFGYILSKYIYPSKQIPDDRSQDRNPNTV